LGSELAMRIISFSIESTNRRLVYTGFEDRGPYWFRESMDASISATGIAQSTKMSSAGTR
jgi:hypothetical protein